jgi:hypothetical protein
MLPYEALLFFNLQTQCVFCEVENYLYEYIKIHVRFEVFTAVRVKNDFSWDVMPCGSCKNRSFGGMSHLSHQDEKKPQARNNVSS